jgi:hypothetical protein
MKILIIGNGFDLAHYLPTAYAHFMGVMKAIEELPEGKTEVTYDDLFAGLEKENAFFFGRTREIYDGDNIRFDAKNIYDMRSMIKNNRWYHYFSNHLKGVDTWIDFEQKMEEVLGRTLHLFIVFKKVKLKYARVFARVADTNHSRDDIIKLDRLQLDFYQLFGLIEKRKSESGVYPDALDNFLSKKYFDIRVSDKISQAFSGFSGKFFDEIYEELERLLCCFDGFLSGVIGVFDLKSNLSYGFEFDRVYSFNYTKTICRFHQFGGEIDFLHGEVGNKDKKIVLGISDLSDGLKDMKMYKFTKYHQKMMNNTDYKFLMNGNRSLYKISNYEDGCVEADFVDVLVWGHSLDASDSDYIKELFGLQIEDSGMVRVKIYFYNQKSKSELLSNLIHVVGREKIENWMKKGWLFFEKAPDLYDLGLSKKL